MDKRGISTLIEVIAILFIVIILIVVISKSNYKTPNQLNQPEVSQSEKWQTNGADN